MCIAPWQSGAYALKRSTLLDGVPLGGGLNESGVVDDGNFWRFEWLLLRKLER